MDNIHDVVTLPTEQERDLTPATKDDVRIIVRDMLMSFHDALVKRGQISPISPDRNYGPRVEET